jgi:glycosyltransferase involved in cell wall biosynthesis
MRVLIDCTQITRTRAGIGIYAENTIAELIRIDSSSKFFLLVQDDDPGMDFSGCSNVTLIRVKAKLFRKLPLRFLLEQLFIPFLAIVHGIDVVHSLNCSFPLMPMFVRKVVNIYDMTMFLMPDVHLPIKVRYFRFFIGAASRRADALIFISHSAHSDFSKLFPHSSPSSHVVHLGKGPQFRPDLAPLEVERVFQRYGLKQPYILYIGMIEPRKNLVRLVKAFAMLSDAYPAHTLVIAGKKGWMYDDLFQLVEERHLDDRVIFTGYVKEQDKPYLIRGADVFAYLSIYEGFGIPILESIACGTPTLTSNVSSMPEVAGDAALLVDPTSELEIAAGLRCLISDSELRLALAQRSTQQAARFNWSKTAYETLQVYGDAVEKNFAPSASQTNDSR